MRVTEKLACISSYIFIDRPPVRCYNLLQMLQLSGVAKLENRGTKSLQKIYDSPSETRFEFELLHSDKTFLLFEQNFSPHLEVTESFLRANKM